MLMKACLVIVLGCLSVANAQNPFCSGDLCFIRPDPNSGKSWMDAQQMCKNNNSTLPIADNSSRWQIIFAALSQFQLNGRDVWLGANASDNVNSSNNWRWLDGNQYTATDVQQRGEYYKSYAYIATRTTQVLAYASPPNVSYSYICQCSAGPCTSGTGRTAFVEKNRCYLKYDEKLPWFSARNKCLENSCDLASFSQLSIMGGMVDYSGCWVGLRHSQWNWQNAVTGLSSDVTFTSWSDGQPNDATPHCMATASGDFPNWKDFDCTASFSYICQVNVSDTRSSSTPYSSSATITTTSTSSTSTTTSTTTTKLPLGTPETAGTTSSATTSTPLSSTPKMSTTLHTANENAMNSTRPKTGSVNMALAIGLGVGLGVPFIILIVAVIVYVAVIRPRKHRNSGESRNAQSTQKFVPNSGQKDTNNGTTETIDKKKKGKTPPENSSTQYATIREANPGGNLVPPSNEGTVYADLRFDQRGS